jgi:hypothetical protein
MCLYISILVKKEEKSSGHYVNTYMFLDDSRILERVTSEIFTRAKNI